MNELVSPSNTKSKFGYIFFSYYVFDLFEVINWYVSEIELGNYYLNMDKIRILIGINIWIVTIIHGHLDNY